MRNYSIAPAAGHDIAAILAWTDENFGEWIRERYEHLIIQSIRDVASDMTRPGSHEIPEIGPDLRVYHLSNSRNRSSKNSGRIRSPRHFLLYRLLKSGVQEIVRVLHDRMELDRNLLIDS